ncbi:sugar ABC transporter ATP-binding protein [Streptomyces scabichelini]|nr:sugar ABC transporter ATP-binding protein [Streptomyces scabichelini]
MTVANLRIRGLRKSFGGAKALDNVDLTVPTGQVHALLGHNGAGKSTLIKCLGGAFAPDAGTIEVGGTSYARLNPRESIAAGVAIIFQTLSVVDSLTVAENIFLGQERIRYGAVNRRAQETLAAGLLERVAAGCAPRDRVGGLPMGQRQLVEIAKALSRNASVLVLDEPTAALSGAESDALAARVEDLRTQGLAIVYVTHLLSEVERLADAVTVLRDGRVDYHSTASGHSRRQLVTTIMGRASGSPPPRPGRAGATERGHGPSDDSAGPQSLPEASGGSGALDARSGPRNSEVTPPSGSSAPGRPAVPSRSVRDGPYPVPHRDPASVLDDKAPDPAAATAGHPGLTVEGLAGAGFGPVGFDVAEGEIVGMYGLIGSGRTRILETLFGRRQKSAGSVRLGGRAVAPARPAEALAAGIALVPADRRAQGLFATLTAQDNVLLPGLRSLARGVLRSVRAERRTFDAVAAAVSLRPARPKLPAAAYSGGNQQKLVLGRWVNERSRTNVLLLDEPTQGVDVGARQEIYRVVAGLAAEKRTAVLFASSDPEEVVALAHRCLIVARGRVIGELAGAQLTEAALLSAVHDTPAEGAA